jgi:hypothetical protein
MRCFLGYKTIHPSVTHPTDHLVFVLEERCREHSPGATAEHLENGSVRIVYRPFHSFVGSDLLVTRYHGPHYRRREVRCLVTVIVAAHTVTEDRCQIGLPPS